MSETFLNGRVTLHAGDSREVLTTLADNSIDSIVTDPPYALVSIVKRFGKSNMDRNPDTLADPTGRQSQNPYKRAAAGFMGKQWDTGETAFAVEFWQGCLRVLKPGGHVVAFGGTRTFHRMACAIEDAGFEIRDQIGWAFGSGFPKSHDVSKGIDKARKDNADWQAVGAWLRQRRDDCGMSAKSLCAQIGAHGEVNHGGAVSNWEKGFSCPTWDQWVAIKAALYFSDDMDAEVWRLNGRKGQPSDAWLSAEVVSTRESGDPVAWYAQGESGSGIVEDKALSGTAIQWQGWGTALKPAWEPICLARKPLSEKTVAANVLRWSVGALNIDGCRIDGSDALAGRLRNGGGSTWDGSGFSDLASAMPAGRWPANVIHDGSDEVIAAFPETKSGTIDPARHVHKNGKGVALSGSADGSLNNYLPHQHHDGDAGSAARFFYTAKADSDDRLGSKHPTVKPVDLMQWLCRLVTRKGGTVLDCFAGTGTTGEAAFREGFNAVLIEREPEYQADIRRRMALVLAGPDERSRESIKARLKDQPADHGPLFGGLEPIVEAAE